jgi:argininosuccinate synthase
MPREDSKTRVVKKVVLAYSGGLDTSIILKWLQTTYGCEVVTFTADLGQGEELKPAREKALLLGIKPQNIFVEDLREEFVRDYVFPMFRANAPMLSRTAQPARATTRCVSSSAITRSSPTSR